MYLLRSRCKCVNSLHAEGQTWRKARNTFFESMLLYPISSRHFKITCDRVGHFLQSVAAARHTLAAGGGVSCEKSSWQQLVLDVTHIFLPVCQFATYLFSTLTPTCPPVPDPLIIPPAYRPSDVSSGLFYFFFPVYVCSRLDRLPAEEPCFYWILLPAEGVLETQKSGLRMEIILKSG